MHSEAKARAHTKVTYHELEFINKRVFKNRHSSANRLKIGLNLRASTRTVQKFEPDHKIHI